MERSYTGAKREMASACQILHSDNCFYFRGILAGFSFSSYLHYTCSVHCIQQWKRTKYYKYQQVHPYKMLCCCNDELQYHSSLLQWQSTGRHEPWHRHYCVAAHCYCAIGSEMTHVPPGLCSNNCTVTIAQLGTHVDASSRRGWEEQITPRYSVENSQSV